MHLSAIQEFDDRELLDIALTFYEVIQKLFFLVGKIKYLKIKFR